MLFHAYWWLTKQYTPLDACTHMHVYAFITVHIYFQKKKNPANSNNCSFLRWIFSNLTNNDHMIKHHNMMRSSNKGNAAVHRKLYLISSIGCHVIFHFMHNITLLEIIWRTISKQHISGLIWFKGFYSSSDRDQLRISIFFFMLRFQTIG